MSLVTLALASLAAQAAPLDSAGPSAPDLDPALWVADLESHFASHVVAAAAPSEHGPACLTPLVWQIRTHWDELSPVEQGRVQALIGPLRGFDEASRAQQGMAPPTSGEPCSSQYRGANAAKGEHFWVEWDGTTISESEAETFLGYLEESWAVEIDDLGWLEPEDTTQHPIAVYVANYPSYAGAFTSVDYCNGSGSTPYIWVGSGSFSAGSWLKTLAAHEFNHTSQFAYGAAHEFWWWEASATFVEESVYPANNDWSDNVYVFSQYPYVGMNAFDSSDDVLFWHTYAMAIWGFHLDNHFGGHQTVVDTWDQSRRHSGQYDYWMPDAVDDIGLDFDEVYGSFLAANTVMDYDESSLFYGVELEDSFTSLPADGEPGRSTGPQSLGANYFKISRSAFDDGDTLEVTFSGDDSVDWYVVLARASGSTVDDWTALDVVNGEGVGSMASAEGEDIYVVVSPMDDDAQGYYYGWADAEDFDYSFEAALLDDGTGDGGAEGDGGSEGPTRPNVSGDDGDSLISCGCSAAPAGGIGLAWAVGLLALARRRDD